MGDTGNAGLDVTVTYANLVADHDQLAAMATRLTKALDAEQPSSADVLSHFYGFATFVREHMAVEHQIALSVEAAAIPSRWQSLWDQGAATFDRLDSEWMCFIEEWSSEAIVSDLAGFRDAAVPMLVTIVEWAEYAARTVYAIALETRQIALGTARPATDNKSLTSLHADCVTQNPQTVWRATVSPRRLIRDFKSALDPQVLFPHR